jgi:hypothetical protein
MHLEFNQKAYRVRRALRHCQTGFSRSRTIDMLYACAKGAQSWKNLSAGAASYTAITFQMQKAVNSKVTGDGLFGAFLLEPMAQMVRSTARLSHFPIAILGCSQKSIIVRA